MAKVAFLVDKGFEDVEFQRPYDELKNAGHWCVVVGPQAGETYEGMHDRAKVVSEMAVADAGADEFDALVIPGGDSPGLLRQREDVVRFTRALFEAGKPVAAVCHGGQVLIEAGVVRDRQVTSALAIRTDLENAGATWHDEPVVEDENLITARRPIDLDALIATLRRRL